MEKRRYLFYIAHPAHYHLLKHSARILEAQGDVVSILVRQKDVLEQLLIEDGVAYTKIADRRTSRGFMAAVSEVVTRERHLLQFAREFRPHLMVGTSIEITHAGTLLGIPSIVLCEDDVNVVPWFAAAAYPFASTIFAPDVCSVGPWRKKKVGYAGYQKLAYLHPNRFHPERSRVESLFGDASRYFIVRTVQLDAHHDRSIRGINRDLLRRLVRLLAEYGRVHISSESPLEEDLEPHRLSIGATDIHHALFFADMYVGDSQSMAVESAVLGTPSLRYSDFVGRIGVLEQLEHKYRLTIGIPADDEARLLQTVRDTVADRSVREDWRQRRQRMIAEKVDVTSLLVWLMHEYPHSHAAFRREPGIQFQVA